MKRRGSWENRMMGVVKVVSRHWHKTRIHISEEVDAPYVPVNCIVLPPTALLHTNPTPFGLSQKTTLGQGLGKLLRKDNMTEKFKKGEETKMV
jgi:hypothetical protein